MAQAEKTEVMHVNKDRLFDVIVDLEKYPEFVDGMKNVKILSDDGNKLQAQYHFSLMKDFEYVLNLEHNRDEGRVWWTLDNSDLFSVNSGGWTLTSEGDNETKVKYELEVDFKISVPGFILKKLVKTSLGPMMKSFETRAQSV